ncbi:hypothetical protein Riv7116_1287 [Rivularia sp. PCC 7116]|uniref:hypothetical protein n=1 Tax=Rivularia sp. PCC 7116 TaxID=373994 RepID=UPI00029F25EA|nr:hypothetical protein [Rivularia sp. PCC 7116]AFY53853.1 hypothetical protein Riv7116_1287 [Rivularia sp. PCC 7116]
MTVSNSNNNLASLVSRIEQLEAQQAIWTYFLVFLVSRSQAPAWECNSRGSASRNINGGRASNTAFLARVKERDNWKLF